MHENFVEMFFSLLLYWKPFCPLTVIIILKNWLNFTSSDNSELLVLKKSKYQRFQINTPKIIFFTKFHFKFLEPSIRLLKTALISKSEERTAKMLYLQILVINLPRHLRNMYLERQNNLKNIAI